MPKEYIGTEPQEWGSVEVSWGRDQAHVQVSVAGPIGWRDEFVDRVETSGSGRVAILAGDVDPDKALDWHVQLRHRHEINKLIRTLRKARDQAFGRDE